MPSPFPEGWFFVTQRKTLDKQGLIRKTWMGTEIVVWSDTKGKVCVSEAFCPHLGSDLGPEAGGAVRGGRLVCGFHGFEFDTGGQCVATPSAPAPRAARLRVFETHEIAGLIFAWWGIDGRAPQWQLPARAPDQHGWSGLRVWDQRFRGHPQETTENSVDLAHLRYVHGYDSAGRVGSVTVAGHVMRSDFEFTTTRRLAGLPVRLDVDVQTLVYGLGYSFVDATERTIGMPFRLWVMATPIDGTNIDFTVASQVGEVRRPKRWFLGLGFLPAAWRSPIMNLVTAAYQKHDVGQDVPIWSRKQYVSRPRLARSDGEIMQYRSYCKQFYPDLAAESGEAETVVDLRAAGDR